MKADLHLHTTASDGRLTPEEIVRLAAQLGVTVISITDHDSIDGIAPALVAVNAFPSLTIVPGVEINTDVPRGEVHLLGYFIDYFDQELCSTLYRLRASRERRAITMIAKLQALGKKVEWQRVQELAGGGSIGRPHIAQALQERGYVASLKEAFTKYIGRDGPAYVEREKITPVGAVRLIVRAQGLPVLAHPADIPNLEELLPELISAGLVGIEVWYDGYSLEIANRLESIVSKYNLIATGGSDYHGFGDGTETILGGIAVPIWAVAQLFDLAGKKMDFLKIDLYQQ